MQLEHFKLHKRKSDTLIYKCTYEGKPCILKSIIAKDGALKQAFYDEYENIRHLSHPGIPNYLWYEENYCLPGSHIPTAVLCIEDCRYPNQKNLSLEEVITGAEALEPSMLPGIIYDLLDLLSYLLKNGVLYTDLNPANILIHQAGDCVSIHLIDYTCCYYYKANPHPSYHIRFSYDLNPDLSGQGMLIQEVSLLLSEAIPMIYQSSPAPFSLIAAIETGKNPPDHLTLEDFTQMLVHAFHDR